MRKTLSLLLAGVMVFGTIGTAFATTDAGNGTVVSYTGTGSEAYTITVPASLTPSSDGDVEVNGTWASNRKLVVTAPATVTLTNDISGADEKVLDVTFAGIDREGDNNRAITLSENIAVGAIENALFGKWEGKIVYTVGMEDITGPVRMLDGDGQTASTFALGDVSFRSSAPMNELQNVQVDGETVDPANYTVSEGSTIITFKPDYVTSLGNGNHTVDINSQGGTASGSFTLTDKAPDDSNTYEGVSGGMMSYDKSSATEINPEEFDGRALEFGDAFEYGDYMYVYCNSGDYMYVFGNSSDIVGWRVYVQDKTKTEYGPILSKIAGEPVLNMVFTFSECSALETAPAIPDTVVCLSVAFQNCTNLTTAPVIPSSVTNMHSAFLGCASLTGTITINANPTNYADCFMSTTQPITLTGSSTILAELAATATYGNVAHDGAMSFDPSKTEISIEEFGSVPLDGEKFEYGDYQYQYLSDGWKVSVLDKTKTEYGTILTSIADKPVIMMNCTFSGCTNLTNAPAIPSSVTMMIGVFNDCPSLTKVTLPCSLDESALNGCTASVEYYHIDGCSGSCGK